MFHFNKNAPIANPVTKGLLNTNRAELTGNLTTLAGEIPADLNGVVYISYPVGSVNSGGLPFPQKNADGSNNSEYASPIMNGDGMMLKIAFDGNKPISLKSCLMKTPCYWADYNTRKGTWLNKFFGFKNFGITRLSILLGARNELNTAPIPVKFGSNNTSILATYDVGRPFLVDPISLDLITPVGFSNEWLAGTPAMVPWTFNLVQSTAHPSFDPKTQELFTVNYTKEKTSQVANAQTHRYLRKNKKLFKAKLTEHLKGMSADMHIDDRRSSLELFFKDLKKSIEPEKAKRSEPISVETSDTGGVTVMLMRWKGDKLIEKWNLKDQYGNLLQIKECMHQTGITEDYIVLTDCSFKFSIDLLVNNPFPEDENIDRAIRALLSNPALPYTDVYIVKRSELTAGGGDAVAYAINNPIPLETIHYSCNFANPNGKIKIFAVHNNASCVAEWLRSYDTQYTNQAGINPDLMSLFAIGSMDINRFGKWVIDVNTLSIVEEESACVAEPGNPGAADVGPNTWSIGLYTYRDMISADTRVNEVNKLFFVTNGLDEEMLSQFIYDLYKDVSDRLISLEEVIAHTKTGVPFGLMQLDTNSMKIENYYQFEPNTYIRSVQFVPKPVATLGIDPQLDGYIFSSVQSGTLQADGSYVYRGEFWIFDANHLKAGPITKLYMPGLEFCFTLHSSWVPKALPNTLPYLVNIKTDYNQVISKLNFFVRLLIKPFVSVYVYPYFKQK
jgi:carotenoid cleavage dioxygenase-like enzyme